MEDIRTHLLACDDRFQPRLSARVDIAEYARKIRERAQTFEAWDGRRLVALVAAYVNVAQRTSYITSVSVTPGFERRGLATRLLGQAMRHLEREGIAAVSLEAAKENSSSLRLYARFGFVPVEERGAFCLMRSELSGRIAPRQEGTIS
jgi:ribosomal-protein-alanine N-acetyltransferase